MTYEIRRYDIANPYELFALINGLMLRDKAKTEVQVQNPRQESDALLHVLLHDAQNKTNPVWDPLKLMITNSEGIRESYVLSLANLENDINEDSLSSYFYYLGKLLGQFTFLNLFHRNTELTFLEDTYTQTKTYLEIMIRSFPTFSSKYLDLNSSDEEKQDVEKYENSKLFLELNQSFIDDLQEIERFTKYENVYVPVSTIMALNYISLFYTIFGITLNLRNKNAFELKDFIRKGAENSVKEIKDTLNFSPTQLIQAIKLDSLFYTFKVLTDFYFHGANFLADFATNKTLHCFFNMANEVENYIADENTTEGKDILLEIVGNTIFNIEPNLISFCRADHWIEVDDINFGIASECDNPIVYFNTLSHFLFSSTVYIKKENENERVPNNLFTMVCYDAIYKETHNLNQKVSFRFLKLYIEKILNSDFNIISPKIIFKLIYIASFVRIYLNDKKMINKIQIEEPELAYDVIAIAETVIYYLYQEWFNRKNKIYRFEKRIYSVKTNNRDNITDPLKYEALISIVEYMQLVMFFKKTKYPSAISNLNTAQFTDILHTEYHSNIKSFNSVKSFMEKISAILINLEKNEEYGVDLMMDRENGELGLLYSLLVNPNKDILIDIMTNRTSITDFFTQLEKKTEDNTENNGMITLLSRLMPNEAILGNSSDHEVYKKINTCMHQIMNSDINNYQKFYLIYCLNYQYIKNNQHTLIAAGMTDPNILIINKNQTLNEERGIMNTLEDLSNKVLMEKIQQNQKYGFDL